MRKQISTSQLFTLSFLLVLTIAMGTVNAQSQQPAAQPATTKPGNQDDVVRITTNLIQIDVNAIDDDGNAVTDLKPEDFELYENKKRRAITHFSFIPIVRAKSLAAPLAAAPASTGGVVIPTVTAALAPEQVRRTIAIVVDDLNMSFDSIGRLRSRLRKFVQEQVEPGDLVAIIRTAGGSASQQQFTTDKQRLLAAIDAVKWHAISGDISSLQANEAAPSLEAAGREDEGGAAFADDTELNLLRRSAFAVGTLGTLGYVVDGLGSLPGRKSLILISDGITIFDSDITGNGTSRTSRVDGGLQRDERVFSALSRLIEKANRASAVIYAIDARGLQVYGVTAADSTIGRTQEDVDAQISSRGRNAFNSQEGLKYLAERTGGKAIVNNNDSFGAMRDVLKDQQGYYLLAYTPDEGTFDPKKLRFNDLKVKVNRKGVRVRYRSGFIGVTDEKARDVIATPGEQLKAALLSPFSKNDISINLTSLFSNTAKGGSFLRSALYLNARDLTFTDEPDGWHKATISLLAVTYGDAQLQVDSKGYTNNIRIRGDAYKYVLERGLVYYTDVPIAQPGPYQFRIAVRDEASGRLGSASEFVVIPNLKQKKLGLSGLTAFGVKFNDDGKAHAPAGKTEAPNQTDDELDPESSPAVRRFHQGTGVEYAVVVYNARVESPATAPRLHTQLRVIKDGKITFTGAPVPYDVTNQTDFTRLPVRGALQLGADMEPGDYILQVIVTDELAPANKNSASQWTDFKIIK